MTSGFCLAAQNISSTDNRIRRRKHIVRTAVIRRNSYARLSLREERGADYRYGPFRDRSADPVRRDSLHRRGRRYVAVILLDTKSQCAGACTVGPWLSDWRMRCGTRGFGRIDSVELVDLRRQCAGLLCLWRDVGRCAHLRRPAHPCRMDDRRGRDLDCRLPVPEFLRIRRSARRTGIGHSRDLYAAQRPRGLVRPRQGTHLALADPGASFDTCWLPARTHTAGRHIEAPAGRYPAARRYRDRHGVRGALYGVLRRVPSRQHVEGARRA